jgi:hypothetical protein
MPTISPLARRTQGNDAAFQTNFHDGHALGREHAKVGRFDQSHAAGNHVNDAKLGFSEGYRAGHRLFRIEKDRK